MKYETVYFEDVAEGQDLPPLCFELSTTRVIMGTSATRDWQPQHHDRDYARNQAKARDIFVNNSSYMAWLCRFITDWAGPAAFVNKLSFSMNTPVCAGDSVKITGKVGSKHVEEDKHIVQLEMIVSNQLGPATVGSASVVLPLRSREISQG
ncbi:hypothetical protein ACFLS8_02165 [Chloroflexota bacterium]